MICKQSFWNTPLLRSTSIAYFCVVHSPVLETLFLVKLDIILENENQNTFKIFSKLTIRKLKEDIHFNILHISNSKNDFHKLVQLLIRLLMG
jgi:hypothetical protein